MSNNRVMTAVVVDTPGDLSRLRLTEVPRPEPTDGEVLVRVRACAVNTNDTVQREGREPGTTYPRILGFECVGEVEVCPGGEFEPGQKVLSAFVMGRFRDGANAEFVCLPVDAVHSFVSELDWTVLASIPGAFMTASAALDALGASGSGAFLVRGASTGVGLAATTLAAAAGYEVLGTTRDASKAEQLRQQGVAHVIVDTGNVSEIVGQIVVAGADWGIDMLGWPTLGQSLKAMKTPGVLCNIGVMSELENDGTSEPAATIPSMKLMGLIPTGVRLTVKAAPLPIPDMRARVQSWVDGVASGRYRMPIDRVYPLERLADAHQRRRSAEVFGKVIVTL